MTLVWTHHYLDRCDSTNAELLSGLKSGRYKTGDVIIANRQDKGRGRLDRAWHSPAGNLAFSCAIPMPKGSMGKTPELSLVAGLALAVTLEGMVKNLSVKWPNDILIDGKKAAGILCEAEGSAIVVGIGINWNSTATDFPVDLQNRLTTVADAMGREQDQKVFFERFLGRFAQELDRYERGGLSELLPDLEKRLALRGKTVTVLDGSAEFFARVEGLTPHGHLRVQNSQGEIKEIVSADIIAPIS